MVRNQTKSLEPELKVGTMAELGAKLEAELEAILKVELVAYLEADLDSQGGDMGISQAQF